MEDEPDDAERTRPPLTGDLLDICRELNQRSVNHIVVGGMAINIHGFTRNTEDIDLLIEAEEGNERKVLEVLSLLPDGAAKELRPGEVAEYVVIRVCDEITVDLMAKACGHDYESAKHLISPVVVDGVIHSFRLARPVMENQADVSGEISNRPPAPPQIA
jgi:hypothetical protein